MTIRTEKTINANVESNEDSKQVLLIGHLSHVINALNSAALLTMKIDSNAAILAHFHFSTYTEYFCFDSVIELN